MAAETNSDRIRGLDSIRFICAFWVLLSHSGIENALKTARDPLTRNIGSLVGIAINGPAAVIVFFLISGFCIHYPYRNGAALPLSTFYVRRFVRIGIPFLLVLPFYHLVLPVPLVDTPLWSLICELIYYALYPALLYFARRWGWTKLLVGSYLLAYCVVATKPHATQYMEYGNGLTWIVGLPCWMLGCLIAANIDRQTRPIPSLPKLYFLRCLIVGLSIVCTFLRWHLPGFHIGFNWTLDLFAIGTYYWLMAEIRYWQRHTPSQILEQFGTWSYSLYIVHVLVVTWAAPRIGRLLPYSVLGNFVALFLALFISFIYFLAIEKPAHFLAKKMAAALRSGLETRPAAPTP